MKLLILAVTFLVTISAQARTQQAMVCKSAQDVNAAVNQVNSVLYKASAYKGTKAKEDAYVTVHTQASERHLTIYHTLEISSASNPTVTKLDGEGYLACVLITGETK